ncbi:RNase J family beta-CASP ribonuclease [uncultured Veillonella sp.]|uniref:RNase J family beta-CASP ribonuclease n=1 Tax=uncultured Veillonella sp. TaxID=159268 RepID=UPI0025E2AB4C|nr:RNase J family beta-CASP ribonuclease [uncultured Veillonella sp.]
MLDQIVKFISGEGTATKETTKNEVKGQTVESTRGAKVAEGAGEAKPARRNSRTNSKGTGRTNASRTTTAAKETGEKSNAKAGKTANRTSKSTRTNTKDSEGRTTKTSQSAKANDSRSKGTGRGTKNGDSEHKTSTRNATRSRTTSRHNQASAVGQEEHKTSGSKKDKLMIIPLGGLGEIGKNMTVFQYGDDIIVLDAGLAFPENDMLGVDIVIPDMSYLIENKDKVRAVVITHGHEDHIGSLAYLLKEIDVPVYATNLVCGLIEGKLKENRVSAKKLNVVQAGDEICIGAFKVGFIQTNHSIPDACAVYFETPVGIVVHTGDFKVDQTPVDGKLMDVHKFAELGNRGVLALMSDSTNVEKPGFTPSESTVGPALLRAVGEARGRVVLATFASNVSRLQQACDAAVAFKRKVIVLGRSMVNVSEIAQERGYLNVPEGTFIDVEEMGRYRDDQIMILTTGSQGEPMAGLSRMATNNHRTIEITPNDTVIISATPIPGNEAAVGRTIDNLLRLGANVIYGRDRGIHVSGHGSQEDLKTMLNLVRPKFFIPVHGEYRMLKKHGELAVSMGLVKPNHVLVGDNGQIFEFTSRTGRKSGHVTAGKVFVDGLGVGDVGNIVIRDRQQLAQEGMVIVVMAMDRASGQIVSGPDIVSRGFVYVRDAEDLMNEAQRRVENVIEKCEAAQLKDWATIKSQVRDTLGKFLYEKTRRRPMILPIIQDV